MAEELAEIKSDDQQELKYPRLYRRIQAFIIDWSIFIVMFFAAAMILADYEIHGGIKLIVFAIILIILEPGLVSITGGSIGHHLRGLRIQDQRHGKNINIYRAIIRWIVKNLLGLWSFFFILQTRKHQAIHDQISGSVVILRDPAKLPEFEALSERKLGS